MCYPKPGPRCSAHAAASLSKAITEARESKDQTFADYARLQTKVEEAEREYYATPAGQKVLDQMISENAAGAKLKKERGKLDRTAALAALKTADAGDIKHTSAAPLVSPLSSTEFQSAGDSRKASEEGGDQIRLLIDQSTQWTEKLTLDELTAVHYYTGAGASRINRQLAGATPLETRKQPLTSAKNSIAHIDSALSKYTAAEPVITYRGVSDWFYDKHNVTRYGPTEQSDILEAVYKDYPVGSEVQLSSFTSVSYDPSSASRFARSQIVMEIKTSHAVPIVNISEQNTREREGLLPRTAKLRVAAIQENVSYPSGEKYTVIQMVEV